MLDFIVVGCGLFGATMAHRIKVAGYRCLVLEKRSHIAGNAYDEDVAGIKVHRYGAHIFHTASKTVWRFVNRFASFNHYVNSPLANYKGEIYNLPFNMNTFNRMWGVITPQQAAAKIEDQRQSTRVENPQNLQEQAVNLVGWDIFDKLIRGYTEKQWGRLCTELSPSIIQRVPVRFTYDNNYFNDPYQGIPADGYTALVGRMVVGIDVKLGTNYLDAPERWRRMAKAVIYTGPIDEYFAYRFGPLQYRSLCFETEMLETANYQGNAVVNYTDRETPYTRCIEHKHFMFGQQRHTVISREYSLPWQPGAQPYYPVKDEESQRMLIRYQELARGEHGVVFGGRLGEYQYYDMDRVVQIALERSTPDKLRQLFHAGKQ